jgi:hypothetical protein
MGSEPKVPFFPVTSAPDGTINSGGATGNSQTALGCSGARLVGIREAGGGAEVSSRVRGGGKVIVGAGCWGAGGAIGAAEGSGCVSGGTAAGVEGAGCAGAGDVWLGIDGMTGFGVGKLSCGGAPFCGTVGDWSAVGSGSRFATGAMSGGVCQTPVEELTVAGSVIRGAVAGLSLIAG